MQRAGNDWAVITQGRDDEELTLSVLVVERRVEEPEETRGDRGMV